MDSLRGDCGSEDVVCHDIERGLSYGTGCEENG